MSDKGKFGSEAGFRDGRVVSVVTLPQALSASLPALAAAWSSSGWQTSGGTRHAGSAACTDSPFCSRNHPPHPPLHVT